MRKKIAAGNWKMNLNIEESQALASELKGMFEADPQEGVEVVLAPTFVNLQAVHHLVKSNPSFAVAAQNCHEANSGAYTGEISAAMLKAVGCKYVIIGHSERRQIYGETNELLSKKVKNALANDLDVIFCIGETLEERESDATFDVVKKQLVEGVFHLDASGFSRVVLAYEPVWAIGTGKTATPDQAQQVHAYLRKLVYERYGQDASNETAILYGGSVKADNAVQLFACKDIDGGLVGGASLKSRDFMDIISAFI